MKHSSAPSLHLTNHNWSPHPHLLLILTLSLNPEKDVYSGGVKLVGPHKAVGPRKYGGISVTMIIDGEEKQQECTATRSMKPHTPSLTLYNYGYKLMTIG